MALSKTSTPSTRALTSEATLPAGADGRSGTYPSEGAALAPHRRAALTLRDLDDLPVSEVAALLERTLHATEALLVRARAAFRRAYPGEEGR